MPSLLWKTTSLSGALGILLLASCPAPAEEILHEEHSHYREQVRRIQEALENGKKENDIKSLLTDAKRSARWIFKEPKAADKVNRRLGRRIDKEFFDLNLPVLIHPLPARPFLLQKTTAHSSLVTNFEEGTITVRVSVPFFEDSGRRKARNEAVFLSIILLRSGILDLPVREFVPLSKTIPPEASLSGGTIEQFLVSKGLTRSGLSVEIHTLAAGGGIALAKIVIPVPLHIGDALALDMERSTAASFVPTGREPSPRRNLPPTGLVIDGRAIRVRPFRDLVLLSDTRHILMIPDEGRPSASLPFGWAGWSDGQETVSLEKRVGENPLVVRPEEFLHHQVFVLTRKDAERIYRTLIPSKLLSTGHIMVLVSPQNLLRPTPSPLPTTGHQ